MKRRGLVLALPTLLLAATDAVAVQQPDYLDERPLETAHGRGRLHAPTSWRAPETAKKAWTKLLDTHGRWQAIWDLDRGTPLRVFGEGIRAPGANADASIALDAARKTLAQQLELLAPGTRAADFELVTNVVHGRAGDLRTVAFGQTHEGLPVLGGQIGFLFKHDRLIVMSSAASPNIVVRTPVRFANLADARGKALTWIEDAYGATPTVLETRGLAVLPLLRDAADGQPTIEHRVVTTLVLDLAEPRARWEVYLDAESGAPLARRQLLRFGAGTVRYNVPIRYPAGGRQDFAAVRAGVTADGAPSTTDDAGLVTFTGVGPATVVASSTGSRVRVINSPGPAATQSLALADGGAATWDGASSATLDAQLTGYVHVNLAKTFAKAELNPNLGWLDGQIEVVVNESGRCNAYSSGDDIHFLVAGGQCENTGRLADVIYHEFGHSLHAQSILPGVGAFDPHMSEGTSDYLAATITGDPGMGRGFFVGSTSALRHIDPTGREAAYPADMDGDPHVSGAIIAGALWDARKELITLLGAAAGKRTADDYFYAVLQRSSEIPSSYIEVLAADDDNGNLADGTPNKCVIDRAFAPHGLVDPELGLGIHAPIRDGFTVNLTVSDPPGGCQAAPVERVVIDWKLRTAATTQQVALTARAGTWQGAIPTQPDGSEVEFAVTVTLASGMQVKYPDNIAAPLYQFYVGPLVPVYCTDFEADPFAAGWTHSASGAADDWQWGAPAGNGGDPSAARSGTHVVGNDLGIGQRDGVYSPDTTTTLTSPVIDVTGRTGVRLQYRRWLAVEDGFYDQATVTADGQAVWSNVAGTSEDTAVRSHRDREWVLHDVDLAAAAADGSVQIGFRLKSDQGLELGGWSIDDFCVMARDTSVQDDDGGDDGGCCSTGGGGPVGPIGLGLVTALAALRRRRRK